MSAWQARTIKFWETQGATRAVDFLAVATGERWSFGRLRLRLGHNGEKLIVDEAEELPIVSRAQAIKGRV